MQVDKSTLFNNDIKINYTFATNKIEKVLRGEKFIFYEKQASLITAKNSRHIAMCLAVAMP